MNKVLELRNTKFIRVSPSKTVYVLSKEAYLKHSKQKCRKENDELRWKGLTTLQCV